MFDRQKIFSLGQPALLFVLLFDLGCANPGPPRPPSLHLPESAQKLVAQRTGTHVGLTWTTSTRTTDGDTLTGPVTAVICRQQPAPGAVSLTPPCSPVARFEVQSGLTQFSLDLPPALSTGPAGLIALQVELVNQHNRSAGPSAPVFAASGQAPAPVGPIQVSSLRNAAQITWSPAASEAPVQLSRDLVSTSPGPDPPKKPLRQPATSPQPTSSHATLTLPPASPDPGGMVDRSIHDGDTLLYTAQRVRVVSFPRPAWDPGVPRQVPKSGKPSEPPAQGLSLELRGEPSAPVLFAFRDLAPPAAPSGLAAIAAGAPGTPPSIDLSWEPNPEADLAGYNLFSAEAGTSRFLRLNSEAIAGTAFRDLTAQAGHQYLYHVTAIDQRHHESPATQDLSAALHP